MEKNNDGKMAVDAKGLKLMIVGILVMVAGLILMTGGGSKDPAAEPAVESFYIELAPQPSRLMYKLAVAEEVCRRLVGKLT